MRIEDLRAASMQVRGEVRARGCARKILHGKLTDGQREADEPPEAFYRKYMGGSAMGMYHILKEEAGTSEFYLQRLAQLDLQSPPPQDSFGPGKVRFAAIAQDFRSIADTPELCQFVWGPSWSLYRPSELLFGVPGSSD